MFAKHSYSSHELTSTDAYTEYVKWACEQSGTGEGGAREPYSSLLNYLVLVGLGSGEILPLSYVFTDDVSSGHFEPNSYTNGPG